MEGTGPHYYPDEERRFAGIESRVRTYRARLRFFVPTQPRSGIMNLAVYLSAWERASQGPGVASATVEPAYVLIQPSPTRRGASPRRATMH
jgi:hypothetical protein